MSTHSRWGVPVEDETPTKSPFSSPGFWLCLTLVAVLAVGMKFAGPVHQNSSATIQVER